MSTARDAYGEPVRAEEVLTNEELAAFYGGKYKPRAEVGWGGAPPLTAEDQARATKAVAARDAGEPVCWRCLADLDLEAGACPHGQELCAECAHWCRSCEDDKADEQADYDRRYRMENPR